MRDTELAASRHPDHAPSIRHTLPSQQSSHLVFIPKRTSRVAQQAAPKWRLGFDMAPQGPDVEATSFEHSAIPVGDCKDLAATQSQQLSQPAAHCAKALQQTLDASSPKAMGSSTEPMVCSCRLGQQAWQLVL